MSSPIVQVLFQGRLLQCIPFEGEELRIGRRKDNDIVISNLSVSRCHAKLVRDEDAIFLHDAGSENGCFVNGARVEKTKKVEIGPDDELVIGKHRIVIQWDGAPATAQPADDFEDDGATRAMPVSLGEEASPSDQWKAAVERAGESEATPSVEAQTEMPPAFEEEIEISVGFDGVEEVAGEEAAPVQPEMSREPELEDAPAEVGFEESVDPSQIPDELAAADDEDAVDEEPVPPASDMSPEPAATSAPEASSKVAQADPDESGLFGADPVQGSGNPAPKQAHSNPEIDFEDFDFDLDRSKPPVRSPSPTVAMAGSGQQTVVFDGSVTEARAQAIDEDNLGATQVVHQVPTLAIRNGDDSVRVVPWDAPLLRVGRSSDCDIVLADPRVSRKHAEFEADGDGYRVRDLESINFTFVNGEKVAERALQAGDVVRIENFEITFQFDHVADSPAKPEPEQRNRSTNSLTMIKPSAREFDGPAAPLSEVASAAELTDPGTDLSSDELAIGEELESQLDSLSRGSFEDADSAGSDVISEVEAALELELDADSEDSAGADLEDAGFAAEEGSLVGEAGLEAEDLDSPTMPPLSSSAESEPELGAHVDPPSFEHSEDLGFEATFEPDEEEGATDFELQAPTPSESGADFDVVAGPEPEDMDEVEAEADFEPETELRASHDSMIEDEGAVTGPDLLASSDEDPAEFDGPESSFSAEPVDDDTNSELLLASVVDDESPDSDELGVDASTSFESPGPDELGTSAEMPSLSTDSESPFSGEEEEEVDPLSAAMAEAADSIPDLATPEEDEPEGDEEPIAALFEAPGEVLELTEPEEAPSIAPAEPLAAQTHLYDPMEASEESEEDVAPADDNSLPPSPLASLDDSHDSDGGSLFEAEVESEGESEKPLSEAPEVGGLPDMAQVSFRADPDQTPMPPGKLSIEFALKVEDLSEPVRALFRESREKGMVLPIEIRVKVED